METNIKGNTRLLKMVIKMIFHVVLSILDIFEECKKYK